MNTIGMTISTLATALYSKIELRMNTASMPQFRNTIAFDPNLPRILKILILQCNCTVRIRRYVPRIRNVGNVQRGRGKHTPTCPASQKSGGYYPRSRTCNYDQQPGDDAWYCQKAKRVLTSHQIGLIPRSECSKDRSNARHSSDPRHLLC